ncbi:hypothetical protein ANCDUO_09614 [Ancylostoma duodenale]|uniref:Uncharacterized protein n=1 Tax=Ancylostoma duodenale TaxID=51022 RepID=A0A0C2DCH8_9BILA|nr:hypothetical protein ANCDUO_09614 [Ancylostoma duodenale]
MFSYTRFKVTCEGFTGHGSKSITNIAAEKLMSNSKVMAPIHRKYFFILNFLQGAQKLINITLALRAEQQEILEGNFTKTLADVTTLNLTILDEGVQATAGETLIFESCLMNFDRVEKQISGRCQDAGKE